MGPMPPHGSSRRSPVRTSRRITSPSVRRASSAVCRRRGPPGVICDKHHSSSSRGRLMVKTISALAPHTLDPPSPETVSSADSPTPDEERILTLLGLLGGAPLGPDHIAAVTRVAGAPGLLATLERRG